MFWVTVSLFDEKSGKTQEWYYEDGLKSYLQDQLKQAPCLPSDPWVGQFASEAEKADWACCWHEEGVAEVTQSFVNLIPTAQGGTHVECEAY